MLEVSRNRLEERLHSVDWMIVYVCSLSEILLYWLRREPGKIRMRIVDYIEGIVNLLLYWMDL